MKHIVKNIFLLTLSLGLFTLVISQPYLDDDLDTDTSSFNWGV